MSDTLTKAEVAELCCVSRPAVSQAIRLGILVQNRNHKIDPNHPVNQAYINRPRKKKTKPKKPVGRKPKHQPKTVDTARKVPKPGDAELFDPTQKLIEDTRLKKVTADMKSLEYAQKLGVALDIEALRRIFGPFIDFLLNDMVYLHEQADLLYAEAHASDDPGATLGKALQNIVADIIEKAKAESAKVTPPSGSVKYIFLNEEEDSDDKS